MFGPASVWGVDLAETGLKAVRMSKTKTGLVIDDVEIINYADMTSDADVRKEDLFRLALRQLIPRLAKSSVIVGIPSENVLSRFISLPPVEKRRIHDIVQYEARQQIPFDLNEVLWDYQRVQSEFVPGEEIDIGLFAVRKEHIYDYLEELKPLGTNLRGLQTSPLADYNLTRLDVAPEEPLIVIDVGAKTTDLIVVEGDKFWMRNLRVAGNSFTQAIQRKFNITFEDAENVKKHMARSKHRARIFEVLQPVAQELVSEIQRSVGYYKSLSRDAKFEEILVVGNCFKLYGLHRFLSERLQYKIRVLESLNTMEIAEDKQEDVEKDLPALSAAIGLAMQGIGHSAVEVELLPDDFVIKRELSKKKIPALIGAVLLWIAFVVMFMGKGLGMSDMKPLVNVGNTEVQQAEQLKSEYNGIRGSVNTARINALLGLKPRRDTWSDVLAALTYAIPPTVYVDGFDIHGAGAAAPSGGGGGGPDGEGGPGRAVVSAGGAPGMDIVTFNAYTSARQSQGVLHAPFESALLAAGAFPEVPQKPGSTVKLVEAVTLTPNAPPPQLIPDASTVGFPTLKDGDRPMKLFKVNVQLKLRSEPVLLADRAKAVAEAEEAAKAPQPAAATPPAAGGGEAAEPGTE